MCSLLVVVVVVAVFDYLPGSLLIAKVHAMLMDLIKPLQNT